MGGKGKKRREKNYRAAHGGGANTRLPPPPTPSSLDALPSKLRQIMAFSEGAGKASLKKGDGDGGGGSASTTGKRLHSEDREAKNAGSSRKDDKSNSNSVGAAESNGNQKRNKKRKRKEVKDLRFETTELGVTSSKRKERKKQRLEARKKKHRKANTDNNEDFPGHEEINFGEVVESPPKLVAFPKAFRNAPDASKERLRLQAVEAYRKRNGWTSRPGIELSQPVIESALV